MELSSKEQVEKFLEYINTETEKVLEALDYEDIENVDELIEKNKISITCGNQSVTLEFDENNSCSLHDMICDVLKYFKEEGKVIKFGDIDCLYTWMNDQAKKDCINNYNDVIYDILFIERNEPTTYLWATRDSGSNITLENKINPYYEYHKKIGITHEYRIKIIDRQNVIVKEIK